MLNLLKAILRAWLSALDTPAAPAAPRAFTETAADLVDAMATEVKQPSGALALMVAFTKDGGIEGTWRCRGNLVPAGPEIAKTIRDLADDVEEKFSDRPRHILQ